MGCCEGGSGDIGPRGVVMLVPSTSASSVRQYGGPAVPASFPWEYGDEVGAVPREACKGATVTPWPVWGCGGGDSLVDLFACGCEQEQLKGIFILPEHLHEGAFGAGAAGLRCWV